MDGCRCQQPAALSGSGIVGSSPSQYNAAPPSRQLSSSIMGPTASGIRARPTTQEVIAEAFGRRLHGLDLLSVKKLNALNATAAKLDAHVASRAAAITRTSVVSMGDGGGLAAYRESTRGIGSVGYSPEAEQPQPLHPVSLLGHPQGAGTPTGAPWSPGQQGHPGHAGHQAPLSPQSDASGRYDSISNIADRGACVARLLALQDKVLNGAMDGSQLLSPQASPTGGGSRFQQLPARGESSSGMSNDEQRRLDNLGIRHDSKVAATTVKLFRLTPRQLEAQEGSPPTPPNTQRSQLVRKAEAPGSSAAPDLPPANSRKQLTKSREFHTMTRFIQSLQDGDEVSMINQARSFARYSSMAPSLSADGAAPPRSPPVLPSITTTTLTVDTDLAAQLSSPGSPGSSLSRLTPRALALAAADEELDLSTMSTGQARSKDLLDGLMKAVEMFVGGGAGAGSYLRGDPGGEPEQQHGAGSAASPSTGAAAAAGHGSQVSRPEPQYSGVYGSPERLVDRVRKKGALAVLSNPAGFREEVAAGEVAMYLEIAERCRTALSRTDKHPRDVLAADDLKRQVFNLHYCRPYFVAPRETLPEVVLPLRSVSPRAMARQNTHYVQSASRESVFLSRATDNDSEDIIDTNAVRERQVRKDWNRVVRKDTLRGLVARDDPGVAAGTMGLGHALDACLAVVLRHKDTMRGAFLYYGMQGASITDYCFSIGLNDWRSFVTDCGLAGHHPDAGSAADTATATSSVRTPLSGRGAAQQQQPAGVVALGTRGSALNPAPRGSVAGNGQSPNRVVRMAAAADAAPGGAVGGAVGGARGGPGALRPPPGLVPPREPERQAVAHVGSGGVGAAAAASQSPNQYADAVFSAVNVEPEKRILEGQVLMHRTLLRFEWYEALIRLATLRHVKGGEKCGSIAAALEHMWSREVLPALPPSMLHEPNQWRISRLYADQEVNELFISHMDLITALYSLFVVASKNKLMHLADWVGLLNTCALLGGEGDATGITQHAAKLAYARSLCVVVDEMGRWGRAVCLDKCDLMEALARLAEELAPPPLEEVAEAMREAGLTGRELRTALQHPWRYYYNELPVELLVSRRLAAAEAAAARSTTTGEEPSAIWSSDGLDGGNSRSQLSRGSRPGSAGGAAVPPPTGSSPPLSWLSLPRLSFQLEALLDLMFGRLRHHWECADNQELAARLQATAQSLQAEAP